jgi:hypothetical protein
MKCLAMLEEGASPKAHQLKNSGTILCKPIFLSKLSIDMKLALLCINLGNPVVFR